MSTRPINLVMLVDNAYYCNKTKSLQENSSLVAKLLTDGYYGFNQWGIKMAYEMGETREDIIFRYLQNVIIYAMFDDLTVRQSEYNAYTKWCSNAGFKAMTPSEITAYRNKISYQKILEAYDMIAQLRDKIDCTLYHNFVYGIVLMAVVSEGKFTERTYNLLMRFLTPGYDNCPSYYSLMQQVYP